MGALVVRESSERTALFEGEYKSLKITLDSIGPTTSLRGDKDICEAVIKNVADFFLEGPFCPDGESAKQVLRNLRRPPLSSDECQQGIKLINVHPFIVVVPNDMNRDPIDRAVLCTRKFTLGINDTKLVALIDAQRLRAMQMTRTTQVEFLGISEQSSECVARHAKVLACTPRPLPPPPAAKCCCVML